jgi:hypothetical protein
VAVVRVVVDIRTKSELDDQEINKIKDDLHKYAYAVVTEQKLEGNEPVESSTHIHASTERYSCETCAELSNDEVN